MNFELSEEQIAVRDAARDFAQNVLLPGVIERDETQKFPNEEDKATGRTRIFRNDGRSEIRRRRNGYCFVCFGDGRDF